MNGALCANRIHAPFSRSLRVRAVMMKIMVTMVRMTMNMMVVRVASSRCGSCLTSVLCYVLTSVSPTFVYVFISSKAELILVQAVVRAACGPGDNLRKSVVDQIQELLLMVSLALVD